MKLILASRSPYRKIQLESLGIPFDVVGSELNEEILKAKIVDAGLLVKELSFAKAQNVLNQFPKDVVLAADQIVVFDQKILGKTGSLEGSIDQLQAMNGKEHLLLTAYCVLSQYKRIDHLNNSKLKMKSLTAEQIKNYVELDRPFDCAGSYKFEKNGKKLFENIDTEDLSAIIGLPLVQLRQDLSAFGF